MNDEPARFTAAALELEHRTAYRFSILAAMSTRCAAEMYRNKFGVTVVGWKALSIIGRHEPIHPSQAANRTSLDPDKITRAVDRLVMKGLVVRKSDRKDGRRVVLTLTPRGRDVYSEIDRVVRATEARLLSVLAKDELRRFKRSLDKLEVQARRIFTGKGAWKSIVKDARA